jgi:hypothetical protein
MPGSAGQRPTLPTGGRFAPTQGQALGGRLMLAAELFNTAIERAVDYTSEEHQPLAGQAKDAGSAGVARPRLLRAWCGWFCCYRKGNSSS